MKQLSSASATPHLWHVELPKQELAVEPFFSLVDLYHYRCDDSQLRTFILILYRQQKTTIRARTELDLHQNIDRMSTTKLLKSSTAPQNESANEAKSLETASAAARSLLKTFSAPVNAASAA